MASTSIKPDKTQGEKIPPQHVPMLCLIGETRDQANRHCEARLLFGGPYWNRMMEFVEQFAEVRIVSAKYGLLKLDEKVYPYEDRLKDFGAFERHQWTIRTKAMIEAIPVACKKIYCLASGQVLRALATMELDLYAPLAGSSDRRRRQWFERHNRGEFFDSVLADAIFQSHHPATNGPLAPSVPSVRTCSV